LTCLLQPHHWNDLDSGNERLRIEIMVSAIFSWAASTRR
jgi:hypothetical protein